ncbi:hypothetical protein EVAR_53184_1 [Eumeta japonica]|uniref:Uncharacterized protein n=1 Tax=Eumeta variegata TaxID=151549 RepID=A0A4C1YZ13_EUMVA|nr:hypothetical protein EVAR_53184_1 [Eumeta japonica]
MVSNWSPFGFLLSLTLDPDARPATGFSPYTRHLHMVLTVGRLARNAVSAHGVQTGGKGAVLMNGLLRALVHRAESEMFVCNEDFLKEVIA